MFESVPNVPQTEIREYLLSRDARSGRDDGIGAQRLGGHESRAHVKMGESLQENHAQTDTLDNNKNSQLEPQRNTDPGTNTSCPWDIQGDGGYNPQHPSGS